MYGGYMRLGAFGLWLQSKESKAPNPLKNALGGGGGGTGSIADPVL